MSNFKGTPGPWDVVCTPFGLSIEADHPTAAGCRVHIGTADGHNRANADMLAAAPAMFSALKELEEAARQVMAGEMAPSSIQIERMKAQDAMAKALGGAQ